MTNKLHDNQLKYIRELAAFLFVSVAFNNVLHEIIIDKLISTRRSVNLKTFVRFITYERKIFTNQLGDKNTLQGGILIVSPLIYLT